MMNKTKLHFILGGIFFLTVAVTACTSDDADKKDVEKTETPAPVKKDTMEATPGNTAPTPQGN